MACFGRGNLSGVSTALLAGKTPVDCKNCWMIYKTYLATPRISNIKTTSVSVILIDAGTYQVVVLFQMSSRCQAIIRTMFTYYHLGSLVQNLVNFASNVNIFSQRITTIEVTPCQACDYTHTHTPVKCSARIKEY